MKKVLILYPHFPPSNLAGVHRPRLFAQHLPSFGWEPVILTVDEKYYEEELDWNLYKLLPPTLRIEKVKAWKISRPRTIGDIGIRAFFQLYKKAKELIKNENFNFLYIPVPSYYPALLGRWLHTTTGIKYGIDYIDPWVHQFPGSNKIFSRHWFSTQLAKFLEPVAIKRASLITGVAEGYYKEVLVRNPRLIKNVICAAMPYGGEITDHDIINSLQLEPYLFKKKEDKLQMVYAGAMLPKAYRPLEAVFKSIAENKTEFNDVEFHFIGTGSRANDKESFNIKPLAEKYGFFNIIIFEYPKRIPYLDVLVHLKTAGGIFILGSTEPHYTPSKVYQGVLSGKSIMAVLHKDSTALHVITTSKAGVVLAFNGEAGIEDICKNFLREWRNYRQLQKNFDPELIDHTIFDQYSAKEVTRILANNFNLALAKQ